jgi:hypothetical protein
MPFLQLSRSLAVVAALAGFSGHAFAASYDAIAIDDDTHTSGGDAGYGVGEGDTQREAQREAMKSCREHNNSCQVVAVYEQCGAYASSRQHAGTGMGRTERDAQMAALDSCGSGGCKVVVSDCVGK